MNSPTLDRVAKLALVVALPFSSELPAHGGQYRGPADVVIPDPGGAGGGPKAAGPGQPGGPGGVGGVTGGAVGPGSVGGGPGANAGGAAGAAPGGNRPTTPRGGIGDIADLTRWQFWWEFNKDPFIRLKEAIHSESVTSGGDEFYMGVGTRLKARETLKPSLPQIEREVLPALRDAIESTEQRDIVSSVLVALGKIGRDHPDFEILPLMAERLTSGDQEVRETAALAIGISQMVQGVDGYLVDLAADSERGRKLVDRGSVDYRTRSFAAYGLGLVANSTSNVEVKAKCLGALKKILADDSVAGRDVRVAAINALSLLALNPASTDAVETGVLQETLDVLEGYFMQPLGAGDQLIQAHVPTAIAKLLGRDAPPDRLARFKDLFLAELEGKGSVRRNSDDIHRSVVLALGRLVNSDDGRPDNPDHRYSEALLDYYRNGKDQQARYFALIALGQIGGTENRNELLVTLQRANNLERPWAALALGVLAFHAGEAAEAATGGADPDRLIGETLRKALAQNANPDTRAALAIALGLSRYTDAADDLRNLLITNRHQDELAGYLCISLALMDDRRSTDDITDIVADSVRRPELLGQAAIALGKLGDKQVTELLQRMMVEGSQTLAKMSAIASALGFIGDRRTIGPLRDMLFDRDLTELTRAFAAVALGGVADKELLPWNSKIGVDINYRAAVETLTSGGTGILDIL